MPYTEAERKLMIRLLKQYGDKKGVEVYHAMANSGKYKKIFGSKTKRKGA